MVLEQDGRWLLIDCGLMFPDADMHGIDLVLPDFTYLRENADRIVGCVATHGHEDHVGALSFLLRELSFPIYGSALTLGLARNRIEEAGLLDRTELVAVADGERRAIGPFDVEFIPVTHSVPHAFAIAVHTPQGVVLHSGDFKLDLTPVDGRRTDLGPHGGDRAVRGRPAAAGRLDQRRGARVRAQRATGRLGAPGAVRRPATAGASSPPASPATSTASSRSPMPPSPAAGSWRRSGMSMKKNVRLARDLGAAHHPGLLAWSTSRRSTSSRRRRCASSRPVRRASRCRRSALMASGDNRWLKVGRARHGDPLQPRHPRATSSTSTG